MPFAVCYYHVIWTTKNREPFITSEIEQFMLPMIRRKSDELASHILAVNTVSDHIHIAVSIALKIAVSDWVRQVKGFTTRHVNQRFPDNSFRWQEGYGILTFGKQALPYVVGYVEKQKDHHRENTIEPYLECSDD